MPPLLKILAGIPDLFIPRVCLLCKEPQTFGNGHSVCEPCVQSLERTLPPWCPVCGKPFRSRATLAHSPDHLCAECEENPPAYDTARSFGPFDGTLRELIYLVKYQGYASIASEMGAEMGGLAKQEFPDFVADENALVTFVPIDRKRWKERGYDQAKILAQGIARDLKMNIAATLERKSVSTPQTRLPARQRRKILRGVFSASEPARISGKRILLVDDVLTTGSTVSACARELKKAGAASVEVLTICHTVQPKQGRPAKSNTLVSSGV